MSPFPTVFTVQFHSSNCDDFGVLASLHKRLALPRWPTLSWEWTSLRSDSLGSDLELFVGRFSPVAASSFRVLFGGVLSASPINCQKESSRLSVSFCWSSNNCHFSRDDWRVLLSELLRFFSGPNCLSCSVSSLWPASPPPPRIYRSYCLMIDSSADSLGFPPCLRLASDLVVNLTTSCKICSAHRSISLNDFSIEYHDFCIFFCFRMF